MPLSPVAMQLTFYASTLAALVLAISLTGSYSEAIRVPTYSSLKDRFSQQWPTQFVVSESSQDWDMLYHLGGNGPWIPKLDNIIDGGIDIPAGCWVDQVHMLSRHAERYPTLRTGIRMLTLFQRLKHANITFEGELAFVNDWDFFMPDPAKRLENLVPVGPYAGTLEAFATGTKLRTRYEELASSALRSNQTDFWASDSKRVIDSAYYFAAGFFGIDWEHFATLYVVPETPDLGADTLTPGRTCSNYANSAEPLGHDYGYTMLEKLKHSYLPAVAARLNAQNPEFTFDLNETFTLQEMCGFEILARGSSPWCDVFTHEESLHFEYARDLLHYYRAGPGNKYGAAMGWLYLEATADLLQHGPDAGPLFFSFVHDGDIVPYLAALDLFPQPQLLPTTHAPANRTWRTSSTVPMGGRIILERLSCPKPQVCWSNEPFYPNHVYCHPPENDTYVRVNVNDGIVALPGCDSGPGSSCPLDEFLQRVEKRGKEVGDFREVCGLGEDAPGWITFLHQ